MWGVSWYTKPPSSTSPVILPQFGGLKHFPTSNSSFRMTAPGLSGAKPWNNVFCWTYLVIDVTNPHRVEECILSVHSTLYEYTHACTLLYPVAQLMSKPLHHTLWTLVICVTSLLFIPWLESREVYIGSRWCLYFLKSPAKCVLSFMEAVWWNNVLCHPEAVNAMSKEHWECDLQHYR